MWTWNAIGKAPGAWNLAAGADESRRGFLLNALISDELPPDRDGVRFSNSDPVTGQAAWYDVRVRITKAAAGEEGTVPRARRSCGRIPGWRRRRSTWPTRPGKSADEARSPCWRRWWFWPPLRRRGRRLPSRRCRRCPGGDGRSPSSWSASSWASSPCRPVSAAACSSCPSWAGSSPSTSTSCAARGSSWRWRARCPRARRCCRRARQPAPGAAAGGGRLGQFDPRGDDRIRAADQRGAGGAGRNHPRDRGAHGGVEALGVPGRAGSPTGSRRRWA